MPKPKWANQDATQHHNIATLNGALIDGWKRIVRGKHSSSQPTSTMTSKPRSEILKEKGSFAASFDEDENDDNNQTYPQQNEKQSPAAASLMENNDVEEEADPANKEKGSVPPPLRRGRDVSASSRPGAFAQPGINDMNHSGHPPRNNSITSDIERGEVGTQQEMPQEETGNESIPQNTTCATPPEPQPPSENTTDPVVPSQDFLIMATLVEDPPPLIYQITEATAVTLESEEDLDPPRDEGSARSITKTHAVEAPQGCNRRLLLTLIVVIGVLVVAGFIVLLVLLLKGESGGDGNNNNGNTENTDYADTYASDTQPTDNSATDPAWFTRQEHVSFHAVQYRSEIPTDCLDVTPAALTLSCEGPDLESSSVLVVNTGSAHVQCERQNDNAIACHVVSSEDPEFILLAACGGDDSVEENAQTLKAHLAERELTDCGGVSTTTQGGSTTVYTSHAYQSLAVGQFCFDQDEGNNKSDPFDDTEDSMQFMMEPNSCLHGHEEHMDNDSTELVCYQTSSCQAAWTCQGNNCSGAHQCDHTLGEVEAKDPRMGCSSMTMDDMDEDEMMEMAKEKMNRQRHQTRRIRRIS